MKEDAQREREEMERKMMELQEQVRLSQEALVSVIVGASAVIPGGPRKCDCRSKCSYSRRPS